MHRRIRITASPGIKSRQTQIADSFEHRIIIQGSSEWAVAILALASFAAVAVSDASFAVRVLVRAAPMSANEGLGLAVRALSCVGPLLVTLVVVAGRRKRHRGGVRRCARRAGCSVARAALALPLILAWLALGAALWATKLFVVGPIVSAWLDALSVRSSVGGAELVPGASAFVRDLRASQDRRVVDVLRSDHLLIDVQAHMRRSQMHRQIDARRRSIAGAWALELPRLRLGFDTALLSRMTVCDLFCRSLPLFALQCAEWAGTASPSLPSPADAPWGTLDWLIAGGTLISLAVEISTALWLLRSRNFASYIPFESMKPKFEALFRCARRAHVAATTPAHANAGSSSSSSSSAVNAGGAKRVRFGFEDRERRRDVKMVAARAKPMRSKPKPKLKLNAGGLRLRSVNSPRAMQRPRLRSKPKPKAHRPPSATLSPWPPAPAPQQGEAAARHGSPGLLALTPCMAAGDAAAGGKQRKKGRSKRVRKLQGKLGLITMRTPLGDAKRRRLRGGEGGAPGGGAMRV